MSDFPPPTKIRYTYRLRPSKAALRELKLEWDRCRWVWNQCVAASQRAYETGSVCGHAALDRMLTEWRRDHTWLRDGKSVPQQQTVRDFAGARNKAVMDRKETTSLAHRAGFPRFKRKHRSNPSLNYTRNGFRVSNGRLCLAGGVKLAVVWSRELPNPPSSVRIHRDGLGHWYASFVVNAVVHALPESGRVLGVDWGVRRIATTTDDDYDLEHPNHGKRAQARLSRYQRMMARRKPAKGEQASRGFREAKRAFAKEHRHVVNRRRDTARKWAKAVTHDHDAIAVEDFRPKFMARSTLARKAADAAVSMTKAALTHAAAKHGRRLILIDPKNTTTDCGHCTARTKHALPLSQRIYTCASCGISLDRDKNSARVMLNRAGLNPVGVDHVRPRRPSAVSAV